MLKTLGAQIREFKKDSLLTPVFMILEVFMETIIPLMMASIIDQGVEAGNIHHIYTTVTSFIIHLCDYSFIRAFSSVCNLGFVPEEK